MSFTTEADDQRRRLYRSLFVARERWWVVVLCGLFCGLAALVFSVVQTPMYESTATLYVTSGTMANSQNAYQGSLASQQRVDSYVRLVKSDAVLSDAISVGGAGIPIAEARKSVSATSAPDTVLLNVVAVRDSPSEAAALANAVAASMTRYVSSLERPSEREAALAKVTVVTPAAPSESPASPSTVKNTFIGVVFGLMIGFLVVLTRARLDNKIRDESDLEALVGAAPLTIVAYEPELEVKSLVDFDAGASSAAEAYRRLRTNISFAQVDDPARMLMVTSPGEGEGKTTTALNFAVALTEAGARVVLVDSDLRKPTVASRVALNPGFGLTDCLRNDLSPLDAVQQCSVPGLDVLASGPLPPNPAELVGSQRSKIVFEELSREYDYVVVDSPPILPVTDACVLSQWVDGTVVVVRAGRTRRPDLSFALGQLAGVGASVLGTVVNGASGMAGTYQYKYYGSPVSQVSEHSPAGVKD